MGRRVRLRLHPRPAAGRDAPPLPDAGGTWIWRCHIDLTAANPDAWSFIRPLVEAVRRGDLHAAGLRPAATSTLDVLASCRRRSTPCRRRTSRLDPALADDVVYRMGVDPKRPLLLQVSRFDPWKDPIGVIDVYRGVRREYPDVQLALVGSMATDDPEGWKLYREVLRYAGDGRQPDAVHEPRRRRRARGQRVPAGVRGRAPEVAPRGLRADGVRGAVEGRAGGGRQRAAASRCRSGTTRAAGW